jgi:acyl carrier protein
MTAIDERLLRCFASVFQEIAPGDLRNASVESIAAWDSLASVTLADLVQDEFGIEIDLLDVAELDSFHALRTYVLTHLSEYGAGASQ